MGYRQIKMKITDNRRVLLIKHVIMFSCLLLLSFSHYFFWVNIADPTPEMDGFYQYYSPVLDYLKAALLVGNDPFFLYGRCFLFDYPYGLVLVSWVTAGLGLGEFVLAQPYLLNVICILPFLFCCQFFPGKPIERFLTGLIIFFFPLTQICIKQFSVSGLTTAYSLLALLFFRAWLLQKNKGFLAGFALSFWFAAITKHLGIIFIFNFVFVYLLWCVFSKCFDRKILFIVFCVLLGALPFYSFSGFRHYWLSSLHHNFYITRNPRFGIAIFIIIVFLVFILPLFLKKIIPRTGTIALPDFFRNGFALFFLSMLFFHVMISNKFSVFIVGLYGYSFFLPLLFRYKFSGPGGFMYLYIIFTIIPTLMLYCSGVGRAPHVIFLPVFLMFMQTLYENRNVFFRMALLIIFLIIANFFPDYEAWQGKFKNIYTELFKTPAHNPLGWSRYGLGSLKREFMRELEKYYFLQKPGFLVENMDHFIKYHVLYIHAHQHIYAIPHLPFLEWQDFKEDILQEYQQKGFVFFDELFAKGEIPVVVYMNDMSSDTSGAYIPNPSSGSPFNAFNSDLIAYFQASARFENDYNCVALPRERPMLNLCTAKNLPLTDSENMVDYGGPGNIDGIFQAKISAFLSDYRDLCLNKKYKKAKSLLLKTANIARGNKRAEEAVAKITAELQGDCE